MSNEEPPKPPPPPILKGLSFEELANLADHWAEMGENHSWSEDTRREAREMARRLREHAARLRAVMLLRAAREAFDSPARPPTSPSPSDPPEADPESP